MSQEQSGLRTRCVHVGTRKDSSYNSVITPIYATSTFEFEAPGKTKGYDYTRTANPTRTALEENIAALEGGARSTVTCTGMSAETTVLHLLPENSHVVAGHDIYGGTYRLFSQVLSKRGFSFSFVDQKNLEGVRQAIRPNTRAIWMETPSNPLLNIVDIVAVCGIAKEKGLLTIVDNTFMSPYFQKPFALGADLIVHSTTKYINGHSDVVGGAIVSSTKDLGDQVAAMANNLGTTGSPFDAWLVLRGVKTLPCRMEQHAKNAQALAEYLSSRPEVAHVYFPGLKTHPQHELAKRQMRGFGGMLSFDLRGGREAAFVLAQKLELFSFAESLGGVESLIEHPETMSHASMGPEARVAAGILPGNLRVSAGIEETADLLADMEQALS